MDCRLLKKLREKDSHQIELEKREQGFALYLNGANLSRSKHNLQAQAPPTRKSKRSDRKRPSKTAGEGCVLTSGLCIDVCVPAESSHIAISDEREEESRARTAPSKRKSWALDSIELRTEDGDPLHVRAPGEIDLITV